MTCRGYDPKAVKLGKLIKIASASIHDNHKRGAFLRSFTQVAENESRQRGSRKESK